MFWLVTFLIVAVADAGGPTVSLADLPDIYGLWFVLHIPILRILGIF